MLAAATGFELLRPGDLPWTAAAALILVVGLWGLSARRSAVAKLVAQRHRARFLPGYSNLRAGTRVLCAALAAVFLGLALVGPVRGYSLRDFQRKGLDLVFVVDT